MFILFYCSDDKEDRIIYMVDRWAKPAPLGILPKKRGKKYVITNNQAFQLGIHFE